MNFLAGPLQGAVVAVIGAISALAVVIGAVAGTQTQQAAPVSPAAPAVHVEPEFSEYPAITRALPADADEVTPAEFDAVATGTWKVAALPDEERTVTFKEARTVDAARPVDFDLTCNHAGTDVSMNSDGTVAVGLVVATMAKCIGEENLEDAQHALVQSGTKMYTDARGHLYWGTPDTVVEFERS